MGAPARHQLAGGGQEQGWEYLGTHPLGESYLVVSYLGKDKSYCT